MGLHRVAGSLCDFLAELKNKNTSPREEKKYHLNHPETAHRVGYWDGDDAHASHSSSRDARCEYDGDDDGGGGSSFYKTTPSSSLRW